MRILLAALLLLLPGVAWAQRVETPAEALSRDASEYSRLFKVPQAEAERRLRALEASVPVTDAIEAKYRARIAGISIEHQPVFQINVFLTGDAPVAQQHVRLGGLTVPIVFRTGARATRDRVIAALSNRQDAVRAAFPRHPAMGLDPRTGELVILVDSASASGGSDPLRRQFEAILGVPVRIRVVDQVDVNLSEPISAIISVPAGAPLGGGRLEGVSPDNGKTYLCTSAFVVTDGARFGIATAAHCLNNMSFVAPDKSRTPLDFVGKWGWGYHDVQIYSVAGALAGLFYADTARTLERPVTGQRTRDQTRAGDFVCHRGERTGYSCAIVELTDFAPGGDLCGGACLPTWVTVAGPTCKGGDSGAPVFAGTIALGIVKGATYRPDGSCAFYFYMSVDYLPRSWSLVLGETAVAAPPDGAKGTP